MEYHAEHAKIASLVSQYVQSEDKRSEAAEELVDQFFAALGGDAIGIDNLFGKSVVRYLMRKGHWRFDDERFAVILAKFFEPREDRAAIEPQIYVATSNKLIKAYFDYDMSEGRAKRTDAAPNADKPEMSKKQRKKAEASA